MIKLVPHTLREGGLALGIPKWRTTTNIVLRTAWKGIATGVLLGLSRAAGELHLYYLQRLETDFGPQI